MYLGPPRSDIELDKAKKLAAKTFGEIRGVSSSCADEEKRILWDEPDNLEGNGVILVALPDGEVIGMVRLLSRILYRGKEAIPVCGISSVCIAKEQQGKKLSNVLMEAAINQANKLGFELAVLFARRAVDHYYPKFSIYGLSSYPEITIKADNLPYSQYDGYEFRSATKEDIPILEKSYNQSYQYYFGSFKRSALKWKFLLDKYKFMGQKIECIFREEKPVGYIVRSSDQILEIATLSNEDDIPLINQLAEKGQDLKVQISKYHTLRRYLNALDYTNQTRICTYGGHMVGVLNIEKSLERIKSRIEERARSLNLPALKEEFDGLTLSWDGQKASVKFNRANSQNKLSQQHTARLLGVSLLDDQNESILYPGMELHFPFLEHF